MNHNQSNPNWYVIYTYPRAERKVDHKLREMGITTYLPLHKVVRQWSDRKKKLVVPLFPNYIFVKTNSNKMYDIIKIRELVRFVTFEGKPAIIGDKEINSIKKILEGELEVHSDNYENYLIGTKIKIMHGPFSGVDGYLVRKNGKNRFVIQVNALKKAVSVFIPANYVEEVSY